MHTIDQGIKALHSYRAQLLPTDWDAANVEDLADANLLPTIRVKAANATQAHAMAQLASGKQVLRIERIDSGEG